ncbi:rcc01693 family protein [Primorskyibacter sp. S187A]|uniref:rcc01693 family protein n=1 Tax=Primorskyibacter sp. S187A TaxID=3415130 RepID=UPI003C7B7FB4
MSQINWPQIMRAGLRGLGMQPEEFWSLTPAELMLMLGVGGDTAPMTRAGLDRLIAAFPDDDAKGTEDGGSGRD